MSELLPATQDANDGLIARRMAKLFGRNWRTSCSGLLVMIGTIIQLIPSIPTDVKHGVGIGVGLVTGTALVAAKDRAVSGPGRK